MEVLYARCAGLDVHKDTVVAAVRCVSEPRHHEVRSFATTTSGLLALADWLTAHGWVEALPGHVTPHHRTLLALHLQLVDALQAALTELEAAVGKALAPIRQQTRLLMTMPGVSDTVAHVIIAEIGVDMTRFPSAAHLISWAGLCPRNDESPGKRRSTRVRHGAPWLKTTLVTAAWAAVRTKGSYLQAQFLRLKARRGAKKAILAVAASMLGACYYMLRDGVAYRDLGADHFARRDKAKTIGRLVRRLRDLGCEVDVKHAA